MAKAVVVLGSGFSGRTGKLAHRAVERLREALKSHKGFDSILLCGGPTWNGKSEAQAMKEWLVKRRVNSNKIIKEEKSKDTFGNAIYVKRVLLKKDIKNALVVTSQLYLKRTKKAWKFVSGNKLKLNFRASKENLGRKERKIQQKHEKKGWKMFAKVTKGLKAGNDKAVEKRLLKEHPFYVSKNRKIYNIKKLWKIRTEEGV